VYPRVVRVAPARPGSPPEGRVIGRLVAPGGEPAVLVTLSP
jgi:hypothetical protein